MQRALLEDRQEMWREEVRKHHNAAEKDESKFKWCPISKTYNSGDHTRVVHIIPETISEAQAVHLFGPPDVETNGHIYDVGNGLRCG